MLRHTTPFLFQQTLPPAEAQCCACYLRLPICNHRVVEGRGGFLYDRAATKQERGIYMGFAENIRRIRRERGLSQEELAELLEVSRQAVSKWEQGMGYPEAEKLVLLSDRLHVSLDVLFSTKFAGEGGKGPPLEAGTIQITSPHEHCVVRRCKVLSSGRMRGGKDAPHYALFAVSGEGASLWGEPATFLGWYADEEALRREIAAIQEATAKGLASYTLQYSVRTERRGLRIQIQSG